MHFVTITATALHSSLQNMLVRFTTPCRLTAARSYLISQGVDVDAQTADGNSVVWIAANNGSVKGTPPPPPPSPSHTSLFPLLRTHRHGAGP